MDLHHGHIGDGYPLCSEHLLDDVGGNVATLTKSKKGKPSGPLPLISAVTGMVSSPAVSPAA